MPWARSSIQSLRLWQVFVDPAQQIVGNAVQFVVVNLLGQVGEPARILFWLVDQRLAIKGDGDAAVGMLDLNDRAGVVHLGNAGWLMDIVLDGEAGRNSRRGAAIGLADVKGQARHQRHGASSLEKAEGTITPISNIANVGQRRQIVGLLKSFQPFAGRFILIVGNDGVADLDQRFAALDVDVEQVRMPCRLASGCLSTVAFIMKLIFVVPMSGGALVAPPLVVGEAGDEQQDKDRDGDVERRHSPFSSLRRT